ncbi:MAG: NAD(P)H dehydrogenase assembly family protein [Cyanobacteria bacterium P01_H01_bin.15]
MLRPADLVDPTEIGTLLERRPGRRWAVQFERGDFLIDHQNLALAAQLSPESSHPQTHQSPPSH